MPATIYYDNDADLSVLKGKTIAILGSRLQADVGGRCDEGGRHREHPAAG
jgi:ketol-acid reductoisomerase